MEMVKIKNGSVETVVHKEAYNAIYKPKGWKIIEDNSGIDINGELKEKGLTDEKQQNAYILAKQERSRRHFDDGLIRGE